MQLVIKRIPYERPADHFTIGMFGDVHIGSRHVLLPRFKETIARVKELSSEGPTYWIGMGDWANAIVPSPEEKRFDFDTLDPQFITPDQQYKLVENLIRPIASNCLVMLSGNHDDVLRQRHYHDYVAAMASNLNVVYGGVNAYIRLTFERQKHHSIMGMWVHHGFFGGRSKMGKLKRVTDMAEIWDADMYAIGHVHEIDYTTKTKLFMDNNGRIAERIHHFFVTGSYLQGYPEGATNDYVE